MLVQASWQMERRNSFVHYIETRITSPMYWSFQFLLVTGGWSSFYSAISDETEIVTESQASWRTLSARLPVPVYVPKAVSIDNKVLLFGDINALIGGLLSNT